MLIHHALITTSYIDFHNSLKYTLFIFTEKYLLHYAIKRIDMITRKAVSSEKVFH